MCPPPADPLWPIGPTLGQVYVPRTNRVQRVHRREQHEEDSDEQRRQRRRHHGPITAQEWAREQAELDAGTYDDHGRTTHRDDDDAQPHRHIDAVA